MANGDIIRRHNADSSVPFRIQGTRWRALYTMSYVGTCTFILVCEGPSATALNVTIWGAGQPVRPVRRGTAVPGLQHRPGGLPVEGLSGSRHGPVVGRDPGLLLIRRWFPSPTSLVWATDIDALPVDRVVERSGDHLVVRSPGNPEHWWGNLIVFDDAPAPGDGARWEAVFEDAFAEEPRIEHRTFAWDRTDGALGGGATSSSPAATCSTNRRSDRDA